MQQYFCEVIMFLLGVCFLVRGIQLKSIEQKGYGITFLLSIAIMILIKFEIVSFGVAVIILTILCIIVNIIIPEIFKINKE